MLLAATFAPTTTTLPDASVMTAKAFEEACKQPIIIVTTVSMVAMLPINAIGMFAIFTKLNKMFNPQHVRMNQRLHQSKR